MKSKRAKERAFPCPFEVLRGFEVKSEAEPRIQHEEDDNEKALFLREMEGVVPLSKVPKRLCLEGSKPSPYPYSPSRDFQRELISLDLKGSYHMETFYQDDFVEAFAPVVSKDLMNRLREGRFSYQAYLDLHGLKREDAEVELRRFIFRSYSLGMRCVLVVHGKGYNSRGSGPVLKEMVPLWLSKAPLRKIVLAFCSARPYDGGTGALYVLLKRWRSKRPK